MRTTVTLDDDSMSLIDAERRRTGASFKHALNVLIRRGALPQRSGSAPPLPLLSGRPLVDIADVSAVLGDDDDERAHR